MLLSNQGQEKASNADVSANQVNASSAPPPAPVSILKHIYVEETDVLLNVRCKS